MNFFLKINLGLLSLLSMMLLTDCQTETTKQNADSGKYSYESAEGDPLNTRIYTLENGLKVYLSDYKDEPRIQTLVAVRTGSRNDPAETTGLAHYLEHMMFKGTDIIGTINWEEEKKVLAAISDKYEEHRNEADEEKKKSIYRQIDSLSLVASQYAVPNEYDKMISAMGAKGTNAYTSNDETVYINNIPANELEKWCKLEAERFQMLVLRLFHTELETVYEEFNRSQDRDGRWSYQKVLELLMPSHPYGTQSTIGLGEHLKNPSLVNIHRYFEKYYRPNNIAICLSGDLDYDKTIAMIDEHFGSWEAADAEPPAFPEQKPPTQILEGEILGKQEEHVYVGFKFDGAASDEIPLLKLTDMLLSNRKAGIFDLNLNQSQKVLEASAFPVIMKDHSVHMLRGRPRQGQTLEEVRDLLLQELGRIKSGDFDEELLSAVVKDLKLTEMRAMENNYGRASRYVDAFINEIDWATAMTELDRIDAITKDQVVAFANEHYGDNNYVVSYKRIGEADRHKVDKPKITPVQMNRDTMSIFQAEFQKMKSMELKPMFIDYDEEIKFAKLSNGIDVHYLKNDVNDIFSLSYIFDFGTDNDKELNLALSYLKYLGTDKYSPEDLQTEFYKLGLNFNVSAGRRQVNVTLDGLQESFKEGVQLFEHFLSNAQPDAEVYQGMVADIAKQRADNKLNKSAILNGGLANYARYGAKSPYTNVISAADLAAMDINKLVGKLKRLTSHEHHVYYRGPESVDAIAAVLDREHKVPESWSPVPPKTEFAQLDMDKNKVYFVHYDMVQTELMMLSKDQQFNKDLMPYAQVFNEYFGAGLSSIVFQEIREQKALAYSAYSVFRTPSYEEDAHYVQAYVGTQADKLSEAVSAMQALMTDMPKVEAQFQGSVTSAKKKIESERITRDAIYRSYVTAKQRGLDYDVRKDIYKKLPTMTIDDLENFFNQHISGRNYTYIVIGNKNEMDLNILKALGDFEELSLEQVFGY